MTQLQSDTVQLRKPASEVFAFLSDFNNFSRLMPEQVTDWRATSEECSFTIKGMASLGMKYAEKIPHSRLRIVPNGKVPFDFTLVCQLGDTADGSTAQLIMDADLNPFLRLMAEKPLTNFLNLLVNKLKEL
jgi:carbon monoxide dehydrogenase subunit G